MSKVLGVEIGPAFIHICEVDEKVKSPKVYKKVTIRTPENVVRDDAVVVSDALVETLKQALTANHIRTKQMVFTMNSTKIASREVTIPYVKENRVADVIRTNASDFFPVDLDQYELGHYIIGTVENDKGVKQYRVMVLAAPKTLIDSYKDLAAAVGCSVQALDYSGNSIYQMMRAQCDVGVQMVVNIEEKLSMVTIIRDQQVVLQRMISYGVQEAIEAVMNQTDEGEISYEQAVEKLCSTGCMADQTVEGSLNYLVNGISRVMDYYNSRNNENPVEKVYVTGMGGDFLGMDEVLSRTLDLRTSRVTELEGFKLDRFFKGEPFGRYLNCIGAAIAPLGFMGTEADKKKGLQMSAGETDLTRISYLVFGGGVLLALILVVLASLQYKSAEDENKRLQARIRELEPVKTVYAEYLQQKYTRDKLNYFYQSTVKPNEKLVEFIGEMEEKMPASLNVQSFSSTTESVSMSLTVKNKKEAARLISQFRTFESIDPDSIMISSLSDSGAVMNGTPMEEEGMVSFSITLSYLGEEAVAPATTETTQTAETDSEGE